MISIDGGPAFPLQENVHGDNVITGFPGYLRDYFAVQALASGDCPFNSHEHTKRADWAYQEADAMLKAREGE